MKLVKDFRLFKKILRKYYKRHCVKRIDHIRGKRFVSYWEKEDWLGYRIESVDQFTDKIKKEFRMMIGDEVYSAVDIKEYLIVHPRVWIEDEDKTFVVDGFMLTNRDAYAIIREANIPSEFLYPIYKLMTCKNNLYPSC